MSDVATKQQDVATPDERAVFNALMQQLRAVRPSYEKSMSVVHAMNAPEVAANLAEVRVSHQLHQLCVIRAVDPVDRRRLSFAGIAVTKPLNHKAVREAVRAIHEMAEIVHAWRKRRTDLTPA
jgi:hypothetical protein